MIKSKILIIISLLILYGVMVTLSPVSASDTALITPQVNCTFIKVLWVREKLGNVTEVHIPRHSWVVIKPKVTYKDNWGKHRVYRGSVKFKIYNLEGKILYSKRILLLHSYLGGSYYIPTGLQKGHYRMGISYGGSKRLKLNPLDREGDLYIT